MALKNIVAIVREESKESLLAALREANVPGVTISEAKGIGEYVNTYDTSSMNSCYRFEVMVDEQQVEPLSRLIVETVKTGIRGDGIVAVMPVEKILRIWDNQEIDGNWPA